MEFNSILLLCIICIIIHLVAILDGAVLRTPLKRRHRRSEQRWLHGQRDILDISDRSMRSEVRLTSRTGFNLHITRDGAVRGTTSDEPAHSKFYILLALLMLRLLSSEAQGCKDF